MPDSSSLPNVVLIGAGFAGLNAAKLLSRKDLNVTVIDRRNHHLFQPLLYQVATAGLSTSDIAVPIRAVLPPRPHHTVLMATVSGIDTEKRLVTLEHGDAVPYDYLLVASGMETSYFNHPEWSQTAPGLKSLEDALEIRRRVLLAFEAAERTHDEAERDALLTFVVVGGGPTGVELAGSIAELARHALARDFDHISPASAKVVLIEGGPRLIPTFAEELSKKTVIALEHLGVCVQLGARVGKVSDEGVTIGDQELKARTVIWAAGVRASPLSQMLKAPLDKTGRVLVQPDLSIPGHPEVFVAGDLAAVQWGDQWVPGMAPGAMQGGRAAARNILRLINGEKTQPFHYFHKGSMATIGRASAVVEVGKLKLSGLLAWLTWVFVHILYLVGFRSRVIVMFTWAWSWFTYQRGSRLITERAPALHQPALPKVAERPA